MMKSSIFIFCVLKKKEHFKQWYLDIKNSNSNEKYSLIALTQNPAYMSTRASERIILSTSPTIRKKYASDTSYVNKIQSILMKLLIINCRKLNIHLYLNFETSTTSMVTYQLCVDLVVLAVLVLFEVQFPDFSVADLTNVWWTCPLAST